MPWELASLSCRSETARGSGQPPSPSPASRTPYGGAASARTFGRASETFGEKFPPKSSFLLPGLALARSDAVGRSLLRRWVITADLGGVECPDPSAQTRPTCAERGVEMRGGSPCTQASAEPADLWPPPLISPNPPGIPSRAGLITRKKTSGRWAVGSWRVSSVR